MTQYSGRKKPSLPSKRRNPTAGTGSAKNGQLWPERVFDTRTLQNTKAGPFKSNT
jgi:hypothetical protein